MRLEKKPCLCFFRPGLRERNRMFPGRRTMSTFSMENFAYCRNQWEYLLNARIQYFPPRNSNTAFTLSFEQDKDYNWVHHDCSGYLENTTNMMSGQAYAAVIYMSPDADVKKGTGLFKSTETQQIRKGFGLKKAEAGFKGCGKKWKILKCILMLGIFIIDCVISSRILARSLLFRVWT